jgi:hypothetical protein
MRKKVAALDAANFHVLRAPVTPTKAPPKSPKPPRARKPKKLAEFDADKHFWPFVDTSAGPDACHPWIGRIDPGNGYGRLWGITGLPYAHRKAFELAHGPIPRGKHVLHRCVGNRLCTNPDHLYLGNNKQNRDDMAAQGRHRGRLRNSDVLAIVDQRFPNYPLLVKGTKGYPEIAADLGIDACTVYRICTGRTHSKLTGIVKGAKTAEVKRPGKDRQAKQLSLEAVL